MEKIELRRGRFGWVVVVGLRVMSSSAELEWAAFDAILLAGDSCQDVAAALKLIELEHVPDRLDDPVLGNTGSRQQLHLAPTISTLGARRQHFHGKKLTRGCTALTPAILHRRFCNGRRYARNVPREFVGICWNFQMKPIRLLQKLQRRREGMRTEIAARNKTRTPAILLAGVLLNS